MKSAHRLRGCRDGRKANVHLWVDEGRMHEGARKIMQMIMKTEAMEPKGEECSREVETVKTVKSETVKTARRKRHT